jgi:hypothetical protein
MESEKSLLLRLDIENDEVSSYSFDCENDNYRGEIEGILKVCSEDIKQFISKAYPNQEIFIDGNVEIYVKEELKP